MPCYSHEVESFSLVFDNGMQLMGYRWHRTARGASLYLYWQTENELTLSYKVSIRVVNASGQEIVQIDNIPQLWTFPTTAWPPNTQVIDFYSWKMENTCEGCKVSLLVYDENSLTPSLATTESGQRIGPLIDLYHLPDSTLNK